MNILQVAHQFLPETSGGTEVHTHLLSRALQSQGHSVAVCYRIYDRDRPEHELVPGIYDGIPTYRLVNDFSWSQGPDFEFFCSGLDPKFEAVLDEVRPDVVHFQHTGGGLSTSFPSLARRRGVPTLLTLHDFWPMCYQSHLLRADGRLCVGPEGGLRCVECWLYAAPEQRVSILRRVRELGLGKALRLAPRYTLDYLGLREYLPPVAYHTTRLMARDTYFRGLLNRFDILLAPSRFLRERYVEWGISPERIRFEQNGVDPAKFEGLQAELPMRPTLDAIYVGSILRHKGLDVLIDAFNQLVGQPVSLRVFGNTESTSDIKHYARYLRSRNCNPQVTFAGAFPNSDVGRVLSTADVVIVPSILYENCPMVILEAQYARRPVIASNAGGMAELVKDGVNGLTFRLGDAGHLADRVRHLLARRDTLLEFQRNIIPPRSMAVVAQDALACYTELLGKCATAG